jgi:hypothetical protein
MRGRDRTKGRRKMRKSKSKCRQRLNDKIKINMKEYEHGLYQTRKQAIAVSYSQTLKKYPRCKKSFSRSRRGGSRDEPYNTFHPNDTSVAKQAAEAWKNSGRGAIQPFKKNVRVDEAGNSLYRNDYKLYVGTPSTKNEKNDAFHNHYHIWNNEQGGYSIHNKGNVPPLF